MKKLFCIIIALLFLTAPCLAAEPNQFFLDGWKKVPVDCSTSWQRAILPECCGMPYMVFVQDNLFNDYMVKMGAKKHRSHAIQTVRSGGFHEKCSVWPTLGDWLKSQ